MLEILVIAFAMGVGGLVQGATGFGFALMAIPLLGFAIDVKLATIVIIPASFTLQCLILWHLRRHASLKRIVPMLIASMATVPLGVHFLTAVDPRIFKIFLGCLLIVSAIYTLVPHFSRQPWHPFYLGVPCGVASGLLGGAFGTNGPPLVAYMTTQKMDRFRYAASLQVLFASSGLVRGIELARQGMFTEAILLKSLVGIVFMVVGAFLGLKILQRLSEKMLSRIVCGLLLVMGVRYLLF